MVINNSCSFLKIELQITFLCYLYVLSQVSVYSVYNNFRAIGLILSPLINHDIDHLKLILL